jgi:hypothetical protein
MRMSTNEQKVADSLHEEIIDELRGETVAIQIRVAFAVLVTVLLDGARRDPDEMKVALKELNMLLNEVQ